MTARELAEILLKNPEDVVYIEDTDLLVVERLPHKKPFYDRTKEIPDYYTIIYPE